LAKQDARIWEKQKELDALKEELNISTAETTSNEGLLDPETLRKIAIQRIEAAARYAELNTLYTHLRGLVAVGIQKRYPDCCA